MFEKEFPMGKETENQLERMRKLLENEKLSKLDKVSYEPKSCISISNYQYDHIKDYVKLKQIFGGDKGETEDKDVKIDCKSFDLKFSSIILLLLFFL